MCLTPELIDANPDVAMNIGEGAGAELYATNAFPPGHSFITLNVGKNKDGYFVNEDLDTQLRFRAIRIFELLHPDCIGLWLFDNSQNHRAMAAHAAAHHWCSKGPEKNLVRARAGAGRRHDRSSSAQTFGGGA